MFDTHTTKTGQEILIAQMEDSHILNTIRALMARLEAARHYAEAPQTASVLYEALNVKPEGWDKKDALACIRWVHERIPAYILEATLRGLEVTQLVQQGYGRSAMIPKPQFPRKASSRLNGLSNPYSLQGLEDWDEFDVDVVEP